MRQGLMTILFSCVVLLAPFGQADWELDEIGDVMSERLAGSWVPHVALCGRFLGEDNSDLMDDVILSFEPDPDAWALVTAEAQAELVEELGDAPMIGVGRVYVQEDLDDIEEYIYVLYAAPGATLMSVLELEDNGMADNLEDTVLIQFAFARESEQSLMFFGEDSDDGMMAWRRAQGDADELGEMPESLAEAIGEAIELMETEQYAGMVNRFFHPGALQEIVAEGELQEVLEQVESNRDLILAMLYKMRSGTPELYEQVEGLVAEFDDNGEPAPVSWIQIDDRWYIQE